MNLLEKTRRGAGWLSLLKGFLLLLSIVEKVVYARLLVPEDFGLFGIALVYVGIINAFSGFGVKDALVQKKEQKQLWDAAWSIRVLKGVVGGLFLLLLAPSAGFFFEASRATPILAAFAGIFLISNLENIGIVFFRKELDFKSYAVYEALPKILSTLAGFWYAYVYQSVWAMVLASAIFWLIKDLFSYWLHEYRPWFLFRLEAWRELFDWGKWSLIGSVSLFLMEQADDVVVAKLLGVQALGFYTFSYSISKKGLSRLTEVIRGVMFPTFSKIKSDLNRLRAVWIRSFDLTMVVAGWVSLGIVVFAREFVVIFLGSKWMATIPLLKVLSLSSFFLVLASPAVLLARGKIHRKVLMNLIKGALMFGVMFPLALNYGLEGVTYSILLGSLGLYVYWNVCVWRELDVPPVLFLVRNGYLLVVGAMIYGSARTLLEDLRPVGLFEFCGLVVCFSLFYFLITWVGAVVAGLSVWDNVRDLLFGDERRWNPDGGK